jgi:hypothetical protein
MGRETLRGCYRGGLEVTLREEVALEDGAGGERGTDIRNGSVSRRSNTEHILLIIMRVLH